MPRRDRNTQIRISRETADTLRRLAAELGYLQTRGIMAGELGSVAQMFDALAKARAAAPADETALFEKALAAYLEWGSSDPKHYAGGTDAAHNPAE